MNILEVIIPTVRIQPRNARKVSGSASMSREDRQVALDDRTLEQRMYRMRKKNNWPGLKEAQIKREKPILQFLSDGRKRTLREISDAVNRDISAVRKDIYRMTYQEKVNSQVTHHNGRQNVMVWI